MAVDLRDVQSVLINAIYFSGEWEYPFLFNKTINFHISNTISVPTNMMCTTNLFNYHRILNGAAEYIELPYKVMQKCLLKLKINIKFNLI